MIEAWRQARATAADLEPWRLALVGDGPLAPAVRAAASRDLSGSASLPVFAAEGGIDFLLSRGGCHVRLGVNEPFGLVALESAAAGTPVLAESRGGAPEILLDGETGWLVDGLDAQLLAQFLSRLPAMRLELDSMGRRAAGDIASRFRFEDTIEALRRAMEEVYLPASSK